LAARVLDENIKRGKVVLQKNDAGEIIETITIVGHSHGGAYSAGMAAELIRLGYKVDVVYYVAPHQPTDIEHPSGPIGVQYSHPNDRISSTPPKYLPVGKTTFGPINGITEFISWQNPDWNFDIYGPGNERGGHHVGLNYEIFSIPIGDIVMLGKSRLILHL